jgi:hypothetical protein
VKTPLPLRAILELADRERRFILAEVVQVKGLMPILMKRRNRQKWTREDIAQMRVHLKRLSKVSPYLVVLVMPGGLVILPVLAWWLDRRRGRRAPPAAAPAG